jgi:hypothetical protein
MTMICSVRSVALAGVLAALSSTVPAATAQAAEAARNGRNPAVSHSVSTAWSGYDVVGGGPYTSVSASWTQPAADCRQTPDGYSSFWVGLDGAVSSTVEQTGADSDCVNGSAVYHGWYEMYPRYPVTFSDPVAPGDSMSASVTYRGNGRFQLVLRDHTRGWTRTVTSRSTHAARTSAEVIAEAPSTTRGVVPLADFGQVGFRSATVDGRTLRSSTPGVDPVTMATTGGAVKARPGPLTGGAFAVTWYHG